MTIARSVLVLDGQTNQALACVRSLGRVGSPVLVASRRRRSLAAWSRHCRASFQLAGETLDAFAAMRRWARDRGVTTVLPMTERSCLLCDRERDEWKAAGITVGCPPADVLLRAFDKARTLDYAQACGVRVPLTRSPISLSEIGPTAESIGLPCVVKGRFSNAWDGESFLPDRGARLVSCAADLETAVLERRQGADWPLVQSFVPGQGRGVFALCDHGRAVAWFAHERLRDVRPSGSGSSLRRSIALEPRLRDPAERLLREMEWHGPAMVEFRDDGEHAPCLIEVNGRFWGSLQLAVDAGVDFPALWVALLHGEDVESVPSGYAQGATLRWLWGDIKRFLYILEGPPPDYPGTYPTRLQGLRELFGPQPSGTRLETWDRRDPWPAVGEWVQGLGELVARDRDGRVNAQRVNASPHGSESLAVSIIIPCRNEEQHIGSCLESVLASDYPLERLQVLVVDGMSTDRTREIVSAFAATHHQVRLLDNHKRITPSALNIGIRAASGEVIMRMDAHVTYPPSYISRLVAALEETGADNVGGVIDTLPVEPTAVARAIALGLSHPFGVGNSYFRIGTSSRRWVDTVPFGCYRRDVFERIGLFDEELIRDQDDELNYRLIKNGGRILLLPDVVSRYYARRSLRQLWRMYYQYGYFKPLVARKVGRVMTHRQLAPALIIVALLGTALLGAWVPVARDAFCIVAGGYTLGTFVNAVPAARAHGVRCTLLLAAVFAVLHFSYGLGFLQRSAEELLHTRKGARNGDGVPLSR